MSSQSTMLTHQTPSLCHLQSHVYPEKIFSSPSHCTACWRVKLVERIRCTWVLWNRPGRGTAEHMTRVSETEHDQEYLWQYKDRAERLHIRNKIVKLVIFAKVSCQIVSIKCVFSAVHPFNRWKSAVVTERSSLRIRQLSRFWTVFHCFHSQFEET